MGRGTSSLVLPIRYLVPALAFAASWYPISTATAAPPVRLSLSECRELDSAEVERLFQAELDAGTSPATDNDVTDVRISCSGARASVKVLDRLSRKTVERSFELSLFVGPARNRLVALGAAELVLASWAELSTNPRPRAEPEGTPPSDEARSSAKRTVGVKLKAAGSDLTTTPLDAGAAGVPRPNAPSAAPAGSPPPAPVTAPANERPYFAPSRPLRPVRPRQPVVPRTRVLALLSMRGFFGSDGVLRGGGVRAGSEPYRYVSWAADALVERGKLLDYDVDSMTLGGWVLAFYRVEPLSFRLGFGLRGGAVSSSPEAGSGATGRSSVAPWGWPLVATTVTIHAGPVAVDLSSEGGYTVLPLRGNEHPALAGSWYSLQLGIGFLFPAPPEPTNASVREAGAGVSEKP